MNRPTAKRFYDRWRRRMPRREALMANRWLRPFAKHLSEPAIWHWNRRAVARGAALGMFITIAIPLPIQILLAALLAVFIRANVPVAALCAFFSNPLTTPAILAAGYYIGKLALAADEALALPILPASGSAVERLLEFVSQASLPIAVGLLIFATLAAVVSYAGVHIGWRIWVGGRWRRRQAKRRAAAVTA